MSCYFVSQCLCTVLLQGLYTFKPDLHVLLTFFFCQKKTTTAWSNPQKYIYFLNQFKNKPAQIWDLGIPLISTRGPSFGKQNVQIDPDTMKLSSISRDG